MDEGEEEVADEDGCGISDARNGGDWSVGIMYLQSALRLLARESKQRDRLAFMANASVALPGDVDSSTRKLASRLSRVDSQRARARRRRNEARMRRALLSGELSAGEVAQRLANISVIEASAADHLIELIESTDSKVAKEICGEMAGGLPSLYAWCTSGLSLKRQTRAADKAVKRALGVRAMDVDRVSTMDVDPPPPRKRMKKMRL